MSQPRPSPRHPAVRADLTVVPRARPDGELDYLVTAPDRTEVFEGGGAEIFLLRRLDGRTSVPEVCRAFEERFATPLAPATLAAFLRRLAGLGFLQGSPPVTTGIPGRRLCNPDRFLARCGGPATWLTGPAGRWLLSFAALFLAVACYRYHPAFLTEMHLVHLESGLLAFLWVPLLGHLLALPLAELAKGGACRGFGGQVTGIRLSFLCRLLPRFTAEIHDGMWLLDQNQRRRVLATGPAFLLLFWWAAAVVWLASEPGSLPHRWAALAAMAGGVFLFLDLLPFLGRDGYLLLADHLGIDDLQGRAEDFFLARITLAPDPEPLTRAERHRFFWFGAGCLACRTAITALLLWLAGRELPATFHGAGGALVVLLVLLRYEEAIRRGLRRLFTLPAPGLLAAEAGAVRWRLLARLALLGVVVVVLILPYPFEVGGDFTILPGRQLGIRSELAGTIAKVLVNEGERVTAGQPVAILDDRLYRKRVASLEAALAEQEALLDLRRKGTKKEAVVKAQQEVEAAAKSLEFSRKEAERYRRLFARQAVAEMELLYAEKRMALDEEKLNVARANLQLIKSGAEDEEIRALEAEVRRLQVELDNARDELQYTTLRAPMAGTIITLDLAAKQGQRLEAGELFAVVEDTTQVLAAIDLPEEDVAEVRPGAPVKLRTWAWPEKTLEGEVTAIGDAAFEKSVQQVNRALTEREKWLGQREPLRREGKVVRVLARFDQRPPWLRSAMTGYAKIGVEERPVALAFSRWLVRLVMVEIWSWLP